MAGIRDRAMAGEGLSEGWRRGVILRSMGPTPQDSMCWHWEQGRGWPPSCRGIAKYKPKFGGMIYVFQIFNEADSIQAVLHTFVDYLILFLRQNSLSARKFRLVLNSPSSCCASPVLGLELCVIRPDSDPFMGGDLCPESSPKSQSHKN